MNISKQILSSWQTYTDVYGINLKSINYLGHLIIFLTKDLSSFVVGVS